MFVQCLKVHPMEYNTVQQAAADVISLRLPGVTTTYCVVAFLVTCAYLKCPDREG